MWYLVHMEELRNVYHILVEKSEGKRPLWTRRRRWKYDIKMNPREYDMRM